MWRRTVVIPALGRIGEHTTEGTRLDTWVDRTLKKAIGRLSDRPLDRLIQIRRPPGPARCGAALDCNAIGSCLDHVPATPDRSER